jgi:lysophospholipase L1-like esterase
MQRDCITLDERLIYIPKIGECRFRNPEFDTTLHFEETGRHRNRTPSFKSEIGIVVLGDSFAMGWGVNDHESFANIIQDELQRPVYNLAVSSYGTVRELLRFQQSGLFNKIDTILIQYCANDIGENINVDNENAFFEAKTHYQERFNGVKPIEDENVLKSINRAFSFAIEKPVRHFRDLLLSTKKKDQFAPHYQGLITVLRKSAALLDNKRVIIFYTEKDRFEGFPIGKNKTIGNVEFLDLELDTNDYYIIDGHLNSLGHKKVGEALSRYLEKPYIGESVR